LPAGLLVCGLLCAASPFNPPERIRAERPAAETRMARPLRYRPDNLDFVIENGSEFFNRPLYGGPTAFRADAGDKPEFSLYLPGQGGNLRLGIQSSGRGKWLHEADRIVSRYRPQAMLYEIHDALLGDGVIQLSAMALYEGDGLIVKAELQNAGNKPLELVFAFGGAGGKRGQRGGDIGCESEPISQFFQLRPENCRGNQFTVNGNQFLLQSSIASIAGIFPKGAKLAIADAQHWNAFLQLLASAGTFCQLPVVVGSVKLSDSQPVFAVLVRQTSGSFQLDADRLEALYRQTEQRREQIASQVKIETPDPYINAAAAALCAAADALWDEPQGSVMHGAAAWRAPYAGWRGPYANDAFGWHDRSKRHLTYWAGRQNTKPPADTPMGADAQFNLARSHTAKQTSGDIGGKHYDMNLVYIDTLIRHLLWTGDIAFAEQLWPVIERHLAWEQRLFRRTFGPDNLPLYEAYAAIWASDDLQYHGGGVTYASAYNYYHNRMIARLAKRLGKDPSPYEKEAELILKAMRSCLWLQECGWYGEWKDLLGLQLVHPNAGLWTFYHTIDSEAASPIEAWQMSRFTDTQIAHIPVYGDAIPKGHYFVLPTTSWMPYAWSTNNTAMAETAHAALAYWQTGRADKAFSLFKGCILDSMYMGTCPGNAQMTSWYDAVRGEAQRDFGDSVGICARAVVEGLFGIRPDALAGELKIQPGFPSDWDNAAIQHPDLEFSFRRAGMKETYLVRPKFSGPMPLRLTVKARYADIETAAVNGTEARWNCLQEAVDCPQIEICWPAAERYEVEIVWKGQKPARPQAAAIQAQQTRMQAIFDGAMVKEVLDPQQVLSGVEVKDDFFRASPAGLTGHRTVFARLEQGPMVWLEPVMFELRPPLEIIASSVQPPEGVCFRIQNNTPKMIDVPAVIRAGRQSQKRPLQIASQGISEEIVLKASDWQLLAGSNRITVELADGRTVEGIVVNWKISLQNQPLQWEVINLKPYYNDHLSRIFQNNYLSPRSPYCSLAIPKQGIGSWCDFARTFEVDDSGLIAAGRDSEGRFVLPQGICFAVPQNRNAQNVVFVSQWDNYPRKAVIPLSGRARQIYLLMAGTTNSMQSRFDNGQVIAAYADGSTERLALHNPTTWWPIDQDYYIDDYAFRRPEPVPPRIHLKTGQVRILDVSDFTDSKAVVPGGAATVLDLALREDKELCGLTVEALANEVIIGLMGITLVR